MDGRALGGLLLGLALLCGAVVSTTPRRERQVFPVILEDVGPSQENEKFFAIKRAVQFSCARTATPFEDELEEKLQAGTDEERLDALRILVAKSCPSSVPLQWKTLVELKRKPQWSPKLSAIDRRFDRRAVLAAINEDVPSHWSIRAAGVLEIPEAVGRLTELALKADLDASLAAERSLEDIPGNGATRSLAMVYASWRYDAFIRAGRALLVRDRERFARLLDSLEPPERYAYRHGLFLAQVDRPSAVPLLCRTVKQVQIIDGQMFEAIGRLGLPDHRGIIENLPEIVRPEQRPQAMSCVAAYQERMAQLDCRQD